MQGSRGGSVHLQVCGGEVADEWSYCPGLTEQSPVGFELTAVTDCL